MESGFWGYITPLELSEETSGSCLVYVQVMVNLLNIDRVVPG